MLFKAEMIFRFREKSIETYIFRNVWNDMTVMEQVKMDAFFYLHLCIPGVLSTLKSELSMRAKAISNSSQDEFLSHVECIFLS